MTLQLPAYLQNAKVNPALAARASQGLGAAMPPRVSRKGGRFTILGANGLPFGNTQPALTIDAIVLGANEFASRVYYEGEFQAGDNVAPDCFSDNGIGPSTQSSKPQHGTCQLCPRATWGDAVSRVTGKGVPSCSTLKKVAVIIPSTGSPTVFLVDIPPKSLKAWRSYVAHVVGQGAPLEFIVTRFKFDDKEPNVLAFEPQDFVPEAFVEPIIKIRDSEEPGIVVGALDRAIATPPVLAAATAPIALPEPKRTVIEPFTTTGAIGAGAQEHPLVAQVKEVVDASIAKDAAFLNGGPPAPEKRPPGRPRKVDPTATPAAAAPPAEEDEAALMRKLEEIRAAKAKPVTVNTTAQPVQTSTTKADSFIQGDKPAFGVVNNAPPAPADIESMLAKAFALPV